MNDLARRMLFLPRQGSELAASVDALHYFVIGVTMLGWAAVSVVTLVFVVRFRRRREDEAGREVRAPARIELGAVLALLGLFLLWWLIGYRQLVRLREAPPGALEVYVTAKQWMWQFSYPEGRSSIGVLTVPSGQPVKLIMTSRDVIHSFFAPEFRIKQDVLPGRYTYVWFEASAPGTYAVYCTEYCGLMHSQMRASIIVLSPEDYGAWLERTEPETGGDELGGEEVARAPTAAPALRATTRTGVDRGLAAEGPAVAERFGCLGCHTTDGRPHIGPTWRGLFGSIAEMEDGGRVRADEAYLTESMMDPRRRVVRGYTPLMPTYQGLLAPAETGALVEYIKSLRAPGPPPLVPAWPGAPGAEPRDEGPPRGRP